MLLLHSKEFSGISCPLNESIGFGRIWAKILVMFLQLEANLLGEEGDLKLRALFGGYFQK